VHDQLCFGHEISGAAKSADGKANLPSSSTGIADLLPSANSQFTANGVQFWPVVATSGNDERQLFVEKDAEGFPRHRRVMF